MLAGPVSGGLQCLNRGWCFNTTAHIRLAVQISRLMRLHTPTGQRVSRDPRAKVTAGAVSADRSSRIDTTAATHARRTHTLRISNLRSQTDRMIYLFSQCNDCALKRKAPKLCDIQYPDCIADVDIFLREFFRSKVFRKNRFSSAIFKMLPHRCVRGCVWRDFFSKLFSDRCFTVIV